MDFILYHNPAQKNISQVIMSPNDYIMLRIANVKLDVAAYVSEKNTEKHLNL